MENICQDPVFGEMRYYYRWQKQESVHIFNKDWEITIAAKAYSHKPICDVQRDMYQCYTDNKSDIFDLIESLLKSYVEEIGYRSDRITDLIQPRTLLFKPDGMVVLLLDCRWDPEHGIGVQIAPNIQIGVQDLFL